MPRELVSGRLSVWRICSDLGDHLLGPRKVFSFRGPNRQLLTNECSGGFTNSHICLLIPGPNPPLEVAERCALENLVNEPLWQVFFERS
jgi:hypothetical protein